MICNACSTPVEVTHTYSNDHTRASRAVCPGCGKVFTIAARLLDTDGRGTGAKALAKRLDLGRMRLELLPEVRVTAEELESDEPVVPTAEEP